MLFDGQTVLAAAPHRIAEIGIGPTLQNLALFPTMTVLQNVMVGVTILGANGAGKTTTLRAV